MNENGTIIHDYSFLFYMYLCGAYGATTRAYEGRRLASYQASDEGRRIAHRNRPPLEFVYVGPALGTLKRASDAILAYRRPFATIARA